MLLDDEVEIKLNSCTVKHYEVLGYDVKDKETLKYRIGENIKVKPQHLTKGSNYKVKVRCDECDNKYYTPWNSYLRYLHKDGKIYCRKCASKLFKSGENSSLWNSNITNEERELKRNYPSYTKFVKEVFARDNYTCQCCKNDIANNGVVHHLDGYNWCKEKREDVTNGILLCKTCHNNFHSIYGNGNNTKEQFEEWIGYTVLLKENNMPIKDARMVYCIEENKVYNSCKEFKESKT